MSNQREDIHVILGLCALSYHGSLHARQIEERCHFEDSVWRSLRVADSSQRQTTEKRQFHLSAAIQGNGQRLADILKNFAPFK